MTAAAARGPALVALDWGTSSLRAYLMTASGAVLESRASGHGIQSLPEAGTAGFERAFAELCADWIGAHGKLPVVAGGMVGSAQGWLEAPYVPCPADTSRLATRAVRVETALGVSILIAPGLIHAPTGAAPDVIRGEEIQIAGALAASPEWRRRSLAVMPGTHSKWVEIEKGEIVRFSTFMTGEMFALLKRHSILGRLMDAATPPAPEEARRAFEMGLRTAADRRQALTHHLFAVRTLGLTGRLGHDVLADHLSGLLIGHEIAAALAEPRPPMPLLLIGEGRLCRRYADALALFGVEVAADLENTAPTGLHDFARAAGLIATEEAARV